MPRVRLFCKLLGIELIEISTEGARHD